MEKAKADIDKLNKIARKQYFLKKNYLSPKALSFPYLRYRFYRPFLKAYYKGFKRVKGTTPWTSPASIEIFEHVLQTNMVGFEWGSGSSTAFLAQRLQKLESVEHNQKWYKKVSAQIKEKNITNVEYHFVSINYPDKHLDKDGYQVVFTEAQLQAYQEYYSLIDHFPDQHFDFVLIDGRARVQCGLHAIPKLKIGGMLVLDNSERPRYDSLKERLKKWPCIWTTNGLTDTTIWIKP